MFTSELLSTQQTEWSSAFLEKAIFTHTISLLSIVTEPVVHFCGHPSKFYLYTSRHFTTIILSTLKPRSFRFYDQNNVWICHLPCVCYKSSHLTVPHFYRLNNTWLWVRIIRFLALQFSSSRVKILRYRHFLSAFYLQVHIVYAFLGCWHNR
jgi:hypothetical protein